MRGFFGGGGMHGFFGGPCFFRGVHGFFRGCVWFFSGSLVQFSHFFRTNIIFVISQRVTNISTSMRLSTLVVICHSDYNSD